MNQKILAYCGLICNEDCPALLATQRNDEKLLKEIAENWSSPDYVLDSQDVICDGCTSKDQRVSEICADCRVRVCAKEREVANCALCQDYPCGQLQNLWEVLKVPQAKDRLDQFKMEGTVRYF